MPMTVSRSTVLRAGGHRCRAVPDLVETRAASRLLGTACLDLADLAGQAKPGQQLGGLSASSGTDQSSKSRTNAYSEAVPYIAHHPWFGQGFGTFLPKTYFFVDNQYLTSLLEIGFVGVTPWWRCS